MKLLLALAALVLAASTVQASLFSRIDSSASNQADAALEVLKRLIGDRSTDFQLVIDTTLGVPARGPMNSRIDSFVVSATNGTVTVRGPTGVALTAGAYWYLKNVTKCQVTWGEDRTGDQLSLPSVLPDVDATQTSTIVPWRYAWNMCTFDYSAVWWDAARWTREIDWMAVHGINLPLALIGQEHVWMVVFQQLGVTLDELEEWFTGPAFLAWQRAGNIRKFAGPLSRQFIIDQRNLQTHVLGLMRGLGMTPVLPCFSGHVPKAVTRAFPNATITHSPPWNNFAPKETDVYVMDPTQPAFKEVGTAFMKAMVAEFGESHFYSCDTFNEVDPTSTSPAYLAASSAAVVDSIRAVDPQGVWVMQAWLFHFGYWTFDRVQAYLNGVPNDSMLILDLNSEDGALAPKFNQYFGKSWIWNMLHNYGGVRGMYGNITRIATGPLLDLQAANSTMVGIGFTPEAIEQNPVMYELLTDTFYAATPIDAMAWLKQYVVQRYGGAYDTLWQAWVYLHEAVYGQAGEPRTELEKLPTWQSPDFGWKNGNPAIMMQAAETMLSGAKNLTNADQNGPLQYDLVDTIRQASTMFFTDVHRLITNQLTHVWYTGATLNVTEVKPAMDKLLLIIKSLDDLLGTNPNYQFGVWTTRATNRSTSANESDLFMYNARNQVTLWGPDGQITDYAAKAWHGLYGTYYYQRWKQMFDSVISTGVQSWNSYTFTYNLLAWEQAWCANTTAFSAAPTGQSAIRIASALLSNISSGLTNYARHVGQSTGDSYGQYSPMWTTRPEQLAVLCDLDPRCQAFDTNGYLRTNAGTLYPSMGSTVYVKQN